MCFAPQRRALFAHLNFQKWSERGMFFFLHFDLEMCFAPQRRALLRHLNFQKWSEREVFLAFLLQNALRATTACNVSSLIWPAGSAPAVLFDLPKPRAPASSFFSLFLFSRFLFSALLTSSPLTFPTSAFPSVHIVGSLTSKLPSIILTFKVICIAVISELFHEQTSNLSFFLSTTMLRVNFRGHTLMLFFVVHGWPLCLIAGACWRKQ